MADGTPSGGGGRRLALGYLGVALAAFLVAVVLWSVRAQVPVLDRIDRLTLDAQTLLRGRLAPDPAHPILLLTLDDASIARSRSFAADRRQLSGAVDRLKADGATVVALDLLLLESSRDDPQADTALAASLASAGNVAIPFALPVDAASTAAPPRAVLDSAYARTVGGEQDVVLHPTRLVAPPTMLAQAAALMGHVTVQRGADGAVRFDLPGLGFDGEVFPSMALRIATRALGLDWRSAEMRFGDAASVGDSLRVPVDAASRQWVNYYGPAGSFETRGIAELLDGRIAPERIRGRIVLIGASALGSGDSFPSPFDGGLPGVERLATVVDNMLSQRVLVRPGWAAPAELAAMLLLPLLSAALIGVWPLRRALPLLLLLAVALAAALQWRFVAHQQFGSWVFPALAWLLSVLLATALRAGAERSLRQAALQALRSSEERYALAATGANDGLWDWNMLDDRVYFSDRWLALMGIEPAARSDMRAWTAPLPKPAAMAFDEALAEHLEGRSLQFHHVLEFHQGGQERWLLARGMAVRKDGRPVRMAGSLTDISEPQRLQRQLRFDAMHDRLTGLPNRVLFREQLAQMLAGADRAEVGMLVLGLDGFRAFNELHGTQAGDAVLADVGQRLRLRDGQALTTARLGPDEFGIAFAAPLVDGDAGPHGLLAWARRSLADGRPLLLTASVGWAHASCGLESADELMTAAEDALARAKTRGHDQLHAFDPAEQKLEQGRRWMRENIELALADGGQFQMYYQPFVRLSDRTLLGFEALIRWHHPERGLVMPGDFIAVAEASGQIAAIGRWTLLQAAAQLRAWVPLGFDGEISVNLSGVQLGRDEELIADARATLAALGQVPPHHLKLEVTESTAMASPQRSAELLQQLARMGFKLSIDDFGTGYSSLAYLHRFPFDTLKVDRSFVTRLAAGREAQEIVRTIVGLALALNKQVLAEGVEDEMQALVLEQLGVQVAQGWLFAKALPAPEAQKLIGASPWHKP